MTKKCEAKTRAGGKCQKSPMPNGRCRLHGGLSTGAPVGNQSAVKHGIYSKQIKPDEQALFEQMKAGSVDDELCLSRILLMRALAAQNKADALECGLEIDERIERDSIGLPGVLNRVSNAIIPNCSIDKTVGARTEVKYRRRDYYSIFDRLLGRIESLEKIRAALITGKAPGTEDMTRQDTFLSPDEPVPESPIL